MNSNYSASIVLITSTSKSNRNFGTGFIIYKDSSSTYILTCAHVLIELGGSDQIKVSGTKAFVVAAGKGNEAGDLAILRISKLLDGDPLKTLFYYEDRSICLTAGFQSLYQDDKFFIKPVRCIPEEEIEIQTRDLNNRIRAWSMRVVGGDRLQPGFSGAPLIREASRAVVGVISHRFGEGERGIAISIEALKDIWFDPPFEFSSLVSFGTLPDIRDDLPTQCRIPYRSLGKSFFGRVAELYRIHKFLLSNDNSFTDGVVLITGVAGIGKTQLAIEYVHRFGNNYPGGIFWINAERGLSIMIDQIAKSLDFNIDYKAEENEQLTQLWANLNSLGKRCLIVLDNFSGDGQLLPWLPARNTIRILVTTKRQDLINYHNIFITYFSDVESIKLLYLDERTSSSALRDLVKKLGGYPLALELTRNFLYSNKNITIEKLLDEMSTKGKMLTIDILSRKYPDGLPSGHNKSVSETFQLSWDSTSVGGKSVLKAISLLAPTPVPRSLIRKILKGYSESRFIDKVDDIINELVTKSSFLELDDENNPRMHSMISDFIKTKINNFKALSDKTISTVIEEMQKSVDEEETQYYDLQNITPHAEFLLELDFVRPKHAIYLSRFISRYYWRIGNFKLAEKFGRKSLELAKAFYREGHAEISQSQYYLVIVLRKLGLLEEAKDIARSSLNSVVRKRINADKEVITIRQSNLALVLRELGELSEAKELFTKALESSRKIYKNKNHPEIATKECFLAMVLQDLGEMDSACSLFRSALNADITTFGREHTKVAFRMSSLALALKDLGKLEEAEEMLRNSLEINLKNYRRDHPWIVDNQIDLSTVLLGIGKYQEAEEILKGVLKVCQEKDTPDHLRMIHTLTNFSLLKSNLGKNDEAVEFISRLIKLWRNTRIENPKLLVQQSEIALILHAVKRTKLAIKISKSAFQKLLKKCGPDHRYTKQAERNYFRLRESRNSRNLNPL